VHGILGRILSSCSRASRTIATSAAALAYIPPVEPTPTEVKAVTLVGLPGVPMVRPGDDLPAIVVDAVGRAGLSPQAGDVVVVTSKIVSKAEGCIVDLRTVEPSARARELADLTAKEPELVELVLRESTEVVRAVPGVLLVRHRLGFMSANAAIDRSNADGSEHTALLMPDDPDASAARIKAALDAAYGFDSGAGFGVLITDTHGRPFRRGNIGVAVGVAGFEAVVDRIGDHDLFGRELKATLIPLADELAAASALVSGETDEGLPIVLVRGLTLRASDRGAADLLFPADRDLFR
jgi:coenzyme F420-0:L-glutamate ligase/coenzyme F420-1:gamma-L-glutamate ligase